jgi:hypothetical protein
LNDSRLRAGDFVEVESPAGNRFLRFVGKYKKGVPYDVFGVLRANVVCDSTAQSLSKLPIEYFCTSAASILLKDSRFKKIKGLPLSQFSIPTFRERYGTGWHILEPSGVVPVHQLDNQQRDLPILELVPAEQIVTRLSTNWKPSDDLLDSTEWFIKAISQARRTGWKGFTKVSWEFQIDERRDIEVVTKRLSDLAKGCEITTSAEGSILTITVTPQADALSDGPWLDDLEKDLSNVADSMGARILGHEIE